MFGALMPKEGKYFESFNAHGDLVALGGTTLSKLIAALSGETGNTQRLAEEIEGLTGVAPADE